MTDSSAQATPVPGRFGPLLGLALGCWVGAGEVAWFWAQTPELAGGLGDRVGTLLTTLVVDGTLGALFALILRARARGRARLSAFAAVLAFAPPLLVGLAFVAFASAHDPAPDPRPNVLFISIDTLRADHLDVYGYPYRTAPNLSALAAEGTLFRNAISPTSWTLPAHVTMLTGLHPLGHGVLSREQRIGADQRSLSTLLGEAGYATGAFVGTDPFGNVGSRYGFDQGFEFFHHWPHPRRFRHARLLRELDEWRLLVVDEEVGGATAQVDAVAGWLRGQRRAPFFLFLHFYDVHSKTRGLPYAGPEPFREQFCSGLDVDALETCRGELCATPLLDAMARGEEKPYGPEQARILRCLYDGGIAYMDAELGRLFAVLEEEGLADQTAVVVTSDHGQAFFEHGTPLHNTLYEEITRVPLIVRIPGAPGLQRVEGVVRLRDLAPTLLELTGTAPPPGLQGKSLVPVLRGEAQDFDEPALSVVYGGDQLSLREGPWKLIRSKAQKGREKLEVFDLRKDPGEKKNLAAAERERAKALVGALEHEVQAQTEGSAAPERTAPLSEEEAARLRALGYVE